MALFKSKIANLSLYTFCHLTLTLGCSDRSGGIELTDSDRKGDDEVDASTKDEQTTDEGKSTVKPSGTAKPSTKTPVDDTDDDSTDDGDAGAPEPTTAVDASSLPEPTTSSDASSPAPGATDDDTPTDDSNPTDDAGTTDTPEQPWDGGGAGWYQEDECVFSSPPVPFPAPTNPDAGTPPAPHVTLGSSPFLGSYLATGGGESLYIYTADLRGSCSSEPVTNCFDDCLLSWPAFEAGDRELVEGLDSALFGSFIRPDGARQTTYDGWPLYTYKKDLVPGDTLGQGKGKVWYLAEQQLPNLVIMRAPAELEGIKYLADGRGHTLYAFESDDLGTNNTPPRSNCAAECAKDFRPFSVRALHAVTTLEPEDLSVFSRGQGPAQVSFRGQPLYLAKDDGESGEMNGLLHEGFTLVIP